MRANTSGTAAAHLSGDWTIAGVGQQVPLLTELKIDGAGHDATVAIDCSGIEGIDLSGFQLLFVWLHCIRLRGMRTELVNMPDWMRAAQQKHGLTRPIDYELQERAFV